ncbi:MAG: membrane protein insertase YidC, partial [Akkermansiaceae bacterium]|nr:membrane protein insertase YidC [Akkermansiaceae bacterium]
MYDRKTWVILAICGGLLALNFHYASKNQRAAAEARAREEALQKTKPAIEPTSKESSAGLIVTPPPPPAEEELVTLANDKVSFVFTNIGGGIKTAVFQNEFEVGSKTSKVEINRFHIGGIGTLAGAGETLENMLFSKIDAESVEGKKVVYSATLPSGIVAKKIYSLNEGNEAGAPYLIDLELRMENPTGNAVNLSQWSLFLGEASPLYQAEVPQQTGYFWRDNDTIHFTDGSSFKGGWFSSSKSIAGSPTNTPIQFAGVTNQFFATVIQPKETALTSMWARSSQVTLPSDPRPVTSVNGGLRLPALQLNTASSASLGYRIFIGPKHNPMLREMDGVFGEGWGDVMQYGWFWWVSRPLNWLLNSFHHLIDNISPKWAWGLAIILLTITVRTAIWPLHAKSTHTMKRMAKLQPEMAKLKEKYGDDPNKLNTEMMGLYRKFGINPLGGCLPMLIQIPIFFGFYRMLQYAVELRGQGFLWVDDLSQPDTIWHFAGVPLNLLPIVMAITSFLQIQMTPKTGDKMQQKIIMLMPFMFFFFCYNFASALALYWTTQNIFSIGQTW